MLTTRECTSCASWVCGRCHRVQQISLKKYDAERAKSLRTFPQCNHCLSTLGQIVPRRHSKKVWLTHNPGLPWPDLVEGELP